MEYKYTKISDNELKVFRTETKKSEHLFTYERLLAQRENIIKQKEAWNAMTDEEIAEVDALLAECEKLGISAKVEEEEVILE